MSRGPWVTKGFPVSIRWSHKKARKYWGQGMPIAEMASRLATSPGAIKSAVMRYKWPPRKQYKKRLQSNIDHLTLPDLVTRRCERCLAPYQGPRNTALPIHPDCPKRRMAA